MLTALLLPLPFASALSQEPPKTAKEKQALTAAADELLKLAKLCVSNGAYSDARAELQRAFALSRAQKFPDEIRKIATKPANPKPEFAEKLAEERAKVLQKCANLLVDAAVACRKDRKEDAFERLIRLAAENVPSEETFKRAGLVYFEPYLAWVPEDDAKRLEAGDECIDNKWVVASTVKELDEKHAKWSDPWVLSDEVHELSSIAPLRTTRCVLAHIGSFRAFFLRQFAGLWDLKQPKGKLPVFLCNTRSEMMEVANREAARHGRKLEGVPDDAAAFCWLAYPSLNPCFASFEGIADKRIQTYNMDGLLHAVQHEVVHQICYEYGNPGTKTPGSNAYSQWVVEAVATFMMYYQIHDGEWKLTRLRAIPMFVDGNLLRNRIALCADKGASNPTIKEFVAKFLPWTTQGDIRWAADDFGFGATLTYFLLTAENEKYRAHFVRYLDLAHSGKDKRSSFEECFQGMDLAKMQEEWLRFLGQLSFE